MAGSHIAFSNDDDLTTVLNVDGSWTLSGVWGPGEGIASFATASPGTDAGLFFNIHSTTNPGGEIRSQIIAAADDNDGVINDTSGNDTLYGLGGNDTTNAISGRNDLLVGGDGNDKVWGDLNSSGSIGNDSIDSSNGTDSVLGGGGDDTVRGGACNDQIDGNDGADQLFGEDDNETLSGGEGNDLLNGGNGDDTLLGAVGDETLQDGSGTDAARFIVNSADGTLARVAGGIEVTSVDGVDFVGDDIEILRFLDQDLRYGEAEILAGGSGSHLPDRWHTIQHRIDRFGHRHRFL